MAKLHVPFSCIVEFTTIVRPLRGRRGGISAEELHFPRCVPLFDITEMAARAGAFVRRIAGYLHNRVHALVHSRECSIQRRSRARARASLCLPLILSLSPSEPRTCSSARRSRIIVACNNDKTEPHKIRFVAFAMRLIQPISATRRYRRCNFARASSRRRIESKTRSTSGRCA